MGERKHGIIDRIVCTFFDETVENEIDLRFEAKNRRKEIRKYVGEGKRHNSLKGQRERDNVKL